MAVYSVYLGSTDISDYVVGMGSIPIVDVDYAGQITLPSASITVINNAVVYAVDGVVSFRQNGSRFASFIIEDVVENMEAGTKTLSLVDHLKLLERIYVQDLVNADYTGALGAEDYDGASRNLRCYWNLSSWPHKIRFVTLTHFVKSALVKAGIAIASKVDCTALYGELESGYLFYDNTNEVDVPIFFEELCFHPDQVKYAGLTPGAQAHYDGANLLELVLFCMMVLDASLRYVGDSVVISPRSTGAAISADNVYSYQKRGYINAWDLVRTTASYVQTASTAAPNGFGRYVAGQWGADLVTEAWSAPAVVPVDRKISEKTFAVLPHAIVHRREKLETHYALDEMHTDAYELPNQADYIFANQLCSLLFNRYPASGFVEQIDTVADPSTLAPRRLLRAALDVPGALLSLEF